MSNWSVKYVINDLLTISEIGQPRSRVIRWIFITAQRLLACRNQIQLIILEPSDLGHRIGSFSTTQYMQKKVNWRSTIMRSCATYLWSFLTGLIKIPLVLLTKLGKTHSDEKRSHSLTLRAKVKVIAKIKSQCPGEQKTCLPKNIWAWVPLVIGVTLTRTPT